MNNYGVRKPWGTGTTSKRVARGGRIRLSDVVWRCAIAWCDYGAYSQDKPLGIPWSAPGVLPGPPYPSLTPVVRTRMGNINCIATSNALQ
jgi:hypothetical protein